ncbi:hypothetical protein AAG570_007981 [Ranatra chinensis]|uniref:Uncharacterized protein n=1 Tax=Ranatra chinensis TaxID=642074 RepID=A0ABD0YHA0_9HEMI
MDNSAYVPNPLPPPSLVVFSQAGGLPDALRMQRPFTSQVRYFIHYLQGGAGGFGLRLMDSYPGLPAHLLHLPQFLHPGGVPFPASFPSAFAPPPRPPLKSLTMDDVLATAGAMSPPAHLKEEDDSREPTPGSETTERSTPDEGRGFRREFL